MPKGVLRRDRTEGKKWGSIMRSLYMVAVVLEMNHLLECFIVVLGLSGSKIECRTNKRSSYPVRY
jgi:hypothetical protein